MVSSLSFIVNPNANGGRTRTTWGDKYELLQEELSERFSLDYYMADGIGQGVEKTREAIEEGNELIIAVGGEGTVNEVLNGIYQSNNDDVKLGFLRSGTVNDYLRTIDWPNSLLDEIEIIKEQQYRQTPVIRVAGESDDGSINEKIGLNVADIGVGAKIAHMASVERKWTWIPGGLRYHFLSIRAVLGWANKQAEIEINGETFSGNLSLLTAGFSFSVGGYQVHPHAQPFDEKMAYTMAFEFGKIDMFRKMKMLEKGNHTPEMENIYMDFTDKIEIATEEPVLFEVDGEPFHQKSKHITIEVFPKRFEILKN